MKIMSYTATPSTRVSKLAMATSVAVAVMSMAVAFPEIAQATAGNRELGVVSHYQDARPGRIAVTPDGSKAYVVNALSNSVAVVNTSTGAEVKSISLPDGGIPTNLAISPDGSKVYVLNLVSSSISVIDTKADALAKQSTVSGYSGVNPYGIAFDPNTKAHLAYVTNNDPDNASVSVIDTTTDSQIKTVSGFSTSNEAHGVAFSPDGKIAYVTTKDSAVAIDVASGAQMQPISNYHANVPLNIAFTPDGKKAYITNQGEDTVSVIDVQQNSEEGKVKKFTGHAPAVVSVSPDGSTAYVTSYSSNTVSVIDVKTDTQITTVAYFDGLGPNGVAFRQDPDPSKAGDFAYVANNTTNDVSIIRVRPAAADVSVICPSVGSMYGGTKVAITGANLTDTTTVLFGGVPGTNLHFVSDTKLEVTTPRQQDFQTGPVDVVVQNLGGNGETKNGFTYITARDTAANDCQ